MGYGGRSASLPEQVTIVLPPGTFLNVNVAEWGGVPVAAAAVPADATANTGAVAFVGARAQLINPLGQWDNAASGFFSATSTFTGFANGLPFMQYNAGPIVLANGAAIVLQSTIDGDLRVAVQNVVTVDASGFPVTVLGTVTANQGTDAGAAGPWSVRLSDGAAFYDGAKTGQLPAALVGGRLDENVGAWLGSTAPTVGQKVMASSLPVAIASDQSAVPVTSTQLPAALVGGRLDENVGAWLGSTAPTVGSKTSANSVPVVIASDQGSIPVAATIAATVTTTVAAPSLFTNFGTDPDVSVKATPGVVLSFSCHNLNGSSRFAQLHNKASAPGAGDVPLLTFLIPTGAMIVLGTDFFTQAGIAFGTGIAFGFSTTEATYTAGVSTDQFTQITYI